MGPEPRAEVNVSSSGAEATVIDVMAGIEAVVSRAARERRLRTLLKHGTFRVFDGRVQLLRQVRCGDCGHRHVGDRCKFEWCSDCGEWPTAEELTALTKDDAQGANTAPASDNYGPV